MDRTGAILAMASVPAPDPTRPKSFADAATNLARQEVYEPGSVQKPITIAAALDAGRVDPDDRFRVPDSLVRDDHTIRDHEPHPTWRMGLAGIMAQSSNVGTILAAERMSAAELREYLLRFGYGAPIGLDLAGEVGGEIPPLVDSDWTSLTRASVAYGQGLSTSILHLASAYATIANDGVRVPPHLVAAVVEPDGTERPVGLPEPQRVVSAEAAQQVTALMEAVMGPEGTGSGIVVDGYRVAGKTGTAEKVADGCVTYCAYTASFAGFAPAEDPELVVAVSIQEPKNGRFGGQLAGPVFEDLMEFALPKYGVMPSTTPPPDQPVLPRRAG
jgi:cell division protein FtsI (penicillin-binding protein 3)